MSSERLSHFPAPATIAVSAGVIFRAGQLLITQRQLDSHLGGLWEFPGGKREPNETLEQCLHRELQEELGMEVEVLGLLEKITHAYPNKTYELHFFHCRWSRHEPRAIACAAFRWIGPLELANYSFPPADVRLLEKLRTSPSLWTVG